MTGVRASTAKRLDGTAALPLTLVVLIIEDVFDAALTYHMANEGLTLVCKAWQPDTLHPKPETLHPSHHRAQRLHTFTRPFMLGRVGFAFVRQAGLAFF